MAGGASAAGDKWTMDDDAMGGLLLINSGVEISQKKKKVVKSKGASEEYGEHWEYLSEGHPYQQTTENYIIDKLPGTFLQASCMTFIRS